MSIVQKEISAPVTTSGQTTPAQAPPPPAPVVPVPTPIKEDFTSRYWESTQETLVGLYGKRDLHTGQPIETVNDIIHRVATATALAELKYVLSPTELIDLS